jgi:hypothetical protein
VQTKKKVQWSTGGALTASFGYRAGLSGDKITLLSAVWQKEMGYLSRQWELSGLKQGIIYVKPRSSAAAQELHLRSAAIVRNLNKYFSHPWIKGIRASI